MRSILAYLLLLSSPLAAADITFEARAPDTTGITAALLEWRDASRTNGTLTATGELNIWGAEHIDVDGDGKMDIIFTDHGKPCSTLLRQTGPLQFATDLRGLGYLSFPQEHEPWVFDVNNDGLPDIVPVTTKTSPVLVNTGTALSLGGAIATVYPKHRYSSLQDLNGDGFLDIVSRYRGNGVTTITNYTNLFPTGNTFQKGVKFQEPYPPGLPQSIIDELTFMATALASRNPSPSPFFQVGDIDGDGDSDIILSFDGTVRTGDPPPYGRYLIRNAAGVLEDRTGENGISGTLRPVLPCRDLTGDGRVDVLCRGGDAAGLYVQNLDGTFAFQTNPALTALLKDGIKYVPIVEYRDFDGDGVDDVVICTMNAGKVCVYQNVNGALIERLNAACFVDGYSVSDFNSDGLLDVLGASTIWINTTAGGTPPPPPPPPPPPGTIEVRINGAIKPGATVTIDGTPVAPPATGTKVIEVTDPQASLLRHPLDAADPNSKLAEWFYKSLESGMSQESESKFFTNNVRLFQLALAERLRPGAGYGSRAAALLKMQVEFSREQLALNRDPLPASGTYYQSGFVMQNWCYALAWCRPFIDEATADDAEQMIRDTAYNLWHHADAKWFGTPRKWGGYQTNNPSDNYWHKFFLATAVCSVYLSDPQLVTDRQPLLDAFYGKFRGGGFAEGTGYGLSTRLLFEGLMILRANGRNLDTGTYPSDSVHYWTHALCPDNDRMASVGVLPASREFDLHRVVMLQLAWLQQGTPESDLARWWLTDVRDTMGQAGNYHWDLLDVPGESHAPSLLSWSSIDAGHHFARSSRDQDALYLAFVAGPKSKAVEQQGAFELFAGRDWLANASGTRHGAGTGPATTAAYHNVVRFERDGRTVTQAIDHWPHAPRVPCVVKDDGATWRATAEMGGLYLEDSLEWDRSVEFSRVSKSVTIHDVTSGAAATWQLQLPVEPAIEANIVTAGRLRVSFPCDLHPTKLDMRAFDPRMSSGWRVDCPFVGRITVILEVV